MRWYLFLLVILAAFLVEENGSSVASEAEVGVEGRGLNASEVS